MMLDSISWCGTIKAGKAIEFAPNAGLGDGWDECEQRPTADMDSSQHRSTAVEERHHPPPIDAVRSVVFYSMVIGKSFWSYNIRERESILHKNNVENLDVLFVTEL